MEGVIFYLRYSCSSLLSNPFRLRRSAGCFVSFAAALCLFLILPEAGKAQEAGGKSPLLLKQYKEQEVSGWLMSEKLDGIRAIWDGKELKTRRGTIIHTPLWFTEGFPPFAIDGELWSRRGDFEHIQSIVMDKEAGESWQEIGYYIFDVPEQKGGLLERLSVLQKWLEEHNTKTLHILEQIECKGKEHLESYHRQIREKGGEGVVLREPLSPYIYGRTENALKVKDFTDGECIITGYNEGKGKYQGMTGSLNCKIISGEKQGTVFRLGSGLDDTLRHNPPAVGTVVTFKHYGWTKKGKPRFPVFMRVRVME